MQENQFFLRTNKVNDANSDCKGSMIVKGIGFSLFVVSSARTVSLAPARIQNMLVFFSVTKFS